MDAFRKMSKWISITLLSVMLSNVALADTVTYFHNDISGSPTAATDAAGNLLWKENYKPYGDKLNRSASSNENKIGFHGKSYDDNTGLSYMGARYYDPVLGRFMGIDPVGYQTDNLHSFNRYTYANNNPYKYVDPDGQFAFLAVPAFYLLTALSAFAVLQTTMNSGKYSGSGEVSIGPLSYPGSNIGDSSRWSTGRVHNEVKTDGEKDSKGSNSKSEKGERTRGRPWTGEPGTTTERDAGGNARRYGKDGYPEVDYDAPHPNEAGVGNDHHAHNWDRPADGGPPTFKDRNLGVPYSPLPKR